MLKVLIVDDSLVYRTHIRRVVESIPGIEVVGSATNGEIMLQMLGQKEVDAIILDINMPKMSGLEALKELRSRNHTAKVLMFAAKTSKSAEEVIEALRLGAEDFIVKPEAASISEGFDQIREQIAPKLLQFSQVKEKTVKTFGHSAKMAAGAENIRFSPSSAKTVQKPTSYTKVNIETFQPSAIVVASSTGGPRALEIFVSQLNGSPKVPILIAQHMPENFTKSLAKRLEQVTGIPCDEAKNGEALVKGKIYIAPGNFHMSINNNQDNKGFFLTLNQGPKVNSVRPAADILFESASLLYGRELMGFVLTGMGEDGRAGCEQIKKNGGGVMIQDEESSTVWGMPGAVYKDGLFDKMGAIEECARILGRMCNR